jgi:hypothetical protein
MATTLNQNTPDATLPLHTLSTPETSNRSVSHSALDLPRRKSLDLSLGLAGMDASPANRIDTVVVRWDGKWQDRPQPTYVPPPGSRLLPYKGDLIHQLTHFLANCVDQMAEAISQGQGGDPHVTIQKLGGIIQNHLDLAELAAKDSLENTLTVHQAIHVLDASNNFSRTLISLFEAINHHPEQQDMDTRPETWEISCHPKLCGVIRSRHLIEPDSAQQQPRVPYCPVRTGQEVTFDELANLIRTSRVNIRRLVTALYPKLRRQLREFNPKLGS